MRACDCEVSVDLPSWAPAAIACGIAVLLAVIVAVMYACREMDRHKNFYGQIEEDSKREEDDADRERKEEIESMAYGGCTDEVLVKSIGNQEVKVMMRRRKHQKTDKISSSSPATVVGGANQSPHALNFNIMADKTGRAFELLEEIQRTEPAPSGSHTQIAELVVEHVQTILEKMTTRHFVVYGLLADSQLIIKGHQNLLDNVEEMSMQVKLQLIKPFSLNVIAYQTQVGEDRTETQVMTAIDPTMMTDRNVVGGGGGTALNTQGKKSKSRGKSKEDPPSSTTPKQHTRAEKTKRSLKQRLGMKEGIAGSHNTTPAGSLQTRISNEERLRSKKSAGPRFGKEHRIGKKEGGGGSQTTTPAGSLQMRVLPSEERPRSKKSAGPRFSKEKKETTLVDTHTPPPIAKELKEASGGQQQRSGDNNIPKKTQSKSSFQKTPAAASRKSKAIGPKSSAENLDFKVVPASRHASLPRAFESLPNKGPISDSAVLLPPPTAKSRPSRSSN